MGRCKEISEGAATACIRPRDDPEYSMLTGANKLKADYLVQRCRNKEMHAYLAQRLCTADDWEKSVSSIELHSFSDLNGETIPDFTANLSSDCVVQTNFFKNQSSSDSEYGSGDPFEEVLSHHYKETVSFSFLV